MIRRLFRYSLFASALAVGGLIAWSAFPETVIGSGNPDSEEREVGPVSEVELAGIGNLTVIQGDVPALRVSADDNLLPLIETERSGRKLMIRTRTGYNLKPKSPIAYTLTVPKLEKLTISGAANAKADKLIGENLTVKVSGAGNAALRGLAYQSVTLSLSGAGGATATGTTEKASVSISGAGDIDAAGLKATTADVKVSGAGNASVWATDTLNARVSGAGDIKYRGSPKLEKKVSGAGSVKPLSE